MFDARGTGCLTGEHFETVSPLSLIPRMNLLSSSSPPKLPKVVIDLDIQWPSPRTCASGRDFSTQARQSGTMSCKGHLPGSDINGRIKPRLQSVGPRSFLLPLNFSRR